MITFEEAYEIVIRSARQIGSEQVELNHALRRILAEDVRSDLEMPPFNKSAMDGYACRRKDLDRELAVIETVAAGRIPTKPIRKNQCAKIMTGAMVPDGANWVVMVEHTERSGSNSIRFTGGETSDNICYRGEDIRQGDLVLRRGELIRAQHMAVLASVGCVKPWVACRPRVGIMATGNELVEPVKKPRGAQIRNSNSYQLWAQVAAVEGIPTYYGIAEDTEESLDHTLKKAMAGNDVIIVSGGVSVGEFDLVPGILRKNRFKLLFEALAVKPGKPTVFGVMKDVVCFGLPGNPVSTFNLFELLIKPFLYKMMGHEFRAPVIPMRLKQAVSRKKTNRASWIPVAADKDGWVEPVAYHGSAHVNALCGAVGLIYLPIGAGKIPKGAVVNVRPI
ncbi:MAG: molybdopterin molybdotransferase MoeA [Verrucomicrobia bacterium]|nr:molybdopterin molybdotransferase MoeA [Verrucomicrobiota bacterium]MBU4291560.1 molybdopterin molybdotransferase MoeA [Verrucomicrobiota bacterium]MBU4428826.1 molybdopterin molybdotransferase MoeA [Verrucomicrobiota bacterium]MCG2678379.1 molybdopterin molybdotransferase MoeA [Kiritimatiellia bacterium]